MQRIGAVVGPLRGQDVARRRCAAALLISALLCGAVAAGVLTAGHSRAPGTRALTNGGVYGEGRASAPASSALSAQVRVARISDQLGASDPALWARPEHGGFVARGGGVSAYFAAGGERFGAHGQQVDLSFSGLGRASAPRAVAPRATRNAVEYTYPGVRESYQYGPAGIEQSLCDRPSDPA